MLHTQTARVFNNTKFPHMVFMEPLGAELVLSPGVDWLIVYQSTDAPLEPFEVAIHNEGFAIYHTMHGTTRVIQGEEVIWECNADGEAPTDRRATEGLGCRMRSTRNLVIIFDLPLRTVVTERCLTDGTSFQGSILREVIQDPDSILFYDWLLADGIPVGIELHDTRYNLEKYVGDGINTFHHTSIFPRLIFCPSIVDSPIGCEAFGDLRFFTMENSIRIMTVSIDNWLPVATADRLVAAIRRLNSSGHMGTPTLANERQQESQAPPNCSSE